MGKNILLLIIIQFKIAYSVYYYSSDFKIDKLITHLSSLINLYNRYDVIIHFDTNNSYLIDNLVPELNFDVVKSVTLINYERKITKFRRISSKRVLNVIILENPFYFEVYSSKPKNIRRADVVYYVLRNNMNATQELVATIGLNLFGNVFFLVINDNLISTYTVCYFCGKFSGEIIEYNENYFIDNRTLLPRRFINFYGHTFKIAFIDYFPLVWCEEIGQAISIGSKQYNSCTLVKGTEYRLISTISERLNFKILPILHDNDYLEIINGTGHAIFDIAMGGITVTVERVKLATFTDMYWYESYNALFFFRKFEHPELFSFLEPLRPMLWISIVIAGLLIAITFDFLGKFGTYNDSGISSTRIFWVCTQFLVDQQVPHMTISKLRRRSLFLLTAWCIVCLNMNTAYKSKVLSTLLNPSHKEPLTLMELIKEGYSIVSNKNYGDVISDFFKHSNFSKESRNSLGKLVLLENVCAEFDYAAKHKATVIDEYTSLQYEVRNTCARTMKENVVQLRNVRITRPLRMFGHGWALIKNAPFQDAFNEIITRVLTAGLLLKWRQDATRSMDRNSSVFPYSFMRNNVKEPKGYVSLETLTSPFFVLIVGNVFSLVIFIVEVVYYKFQN